MTVVNTQVQLLEKWAEELESGKHAQAQCVLKTADGAYCCLGVAAEHVLNRKFSTEEGVGNDRLHYVDDQGNMQTGYLTEADAETLGINGMPSPALTEKLTTVAGQNSVAGRNLQSLFSNLNDSAFDPKNFNEIAQVVRIIIDDIKESNG